MIWVDLDEWAQAFQEPSKTMDILNEWLRNKSGGDSQTAELFSTFAEASEQV